MSGTGAIGAFVIGTSPIGGAGSIGSSSFNPPIADLIIELYERLGIQATELETRHIISARRSMNLVGSRWSARGLNLWRMVQVSSALTQGLAVYAVPESAVDIFDCYRRINVGGMNTDTYMAPISRTDYAMLPQKDQQGVPTAFWVNKSPASGNMTLNIWPSPDGGGPYTIFYWAFLRLPDANVGESEALGDSIARHPMYEAWCADVAAHLAVKWATPQRAVALNALAKEIWAEANAQDTERVNTHVTPDLSGYYL